MEGSEDLAVLACGVCAVPVVWLLSAVVLVGVHDGSKIPPPSASDLAPKVYCSFSRAWCLLWQVLQGTWGL